MGLLKYFLANPVSTPKKRHSLSSSLLKKTMSIFYSCRKLLIISVMNSRKAVGSTGLSRVNINKMILGTRLLCLGSHPLNMQMWGERAILNCWGLSKIRKWTRRKERDFWIGAKLPSYPLIISYSLVRNAQKICKE